MRDRRLARCLIYLVCLLGSTPGCQALHLYRPTPVLIRDADTKKPIANVDVRISYPLANSMLAPWESRGTTGVDGIARLKAAPYGDAGIMLDVTVNGYLNEQKFLTAEQVQAFDCGHLFEDIDRRPPCLVMEMYAEPRPKIELIVPAGYRGMVKARIQIKEEATLPPGQRTFAYQVPPSGEIILTGPALFRHIVSTDMRLKYADDVPLSRQASESMRGYWWIKSESNFNYFLVGTQRDCDDYRRSLMGRRMLDTDRPGVRQTEGFTRRQRRSDQPPADITPAGQATPAAFFNRSGGE